MRMETELKGMSVGTISFEEKKMMEAIKEITANGNNAEVRQRSDGGYTVYEVRKNIKH